MFPLNRQKHLKGVCGAVAVLLITCVCGISQAGPLKPNLVTTELVADTAAIIPGKPFTVGVKLDVISGWHVYWINPGDSGQPVEVEWKLPEGFTASPLQYPLPERFKDAGGLISYGYTREVMLISTITPPTNFAKSNDPIKLSANVSWLVCQRECVLGKATASLELPVNAKVYPIFSTEMERWRAAVPKEAAEGDLVHPTKVVLPSNPEKGGKLTMTFDVKPDGIPTAEGLEWFPPASESIQFEQPKFELKKTRLVMSVDYKVFEGQQPEPGRRESVLAFRTMGGVRHGILVPLQFRPEK